LGHLLDRYDAPSGTRSLHAGDRGPVSQAEFETQLTTTLRRHAQRTIIAVVGTADTARYSESFLSPGLTETGFRQMSVREFPDSETRVHMYQRP
jgi:hypothetical protein